jgi:hypothetical protein
MNKYTVILLYPDFEQNDDGLATYTAHVEAENRKAAIEKAEKEAASQSGSCEPEDFAVIAVFAGHIEQVEE